MWPYTDVFGHNSQFAQLILTEMPKGIKWSDLWSSLAVITAVNQKQEIVTIFPIAWLVARSKWQPSCHFSLSPKWKCTQTDKNIITENIYVSLRNAFLCFYENHLFCTLHCLDSHIIMFYSKTGTTTQTAPLSLIFSFKVLSHPLFKLDLSCSDTITILSVSPPV